MTWFLWPISLMIAFLLGMWWHSRLLAREVAAMKTAMWGQFADGFGMKSESK